MLAVGVDAGATPGSVWTTERFYTHETSHEFADIGTHGAGPGDIYVARQALTTLGGADAGAVHGYGVNLQPRSSTSTGRPG